MRGELIANKILTSAVNGEFYFVPVFLQKIGDNEIIWLFR